MKIYTRTGDKGTTALFGGGRVSKDDPRIEAYGTVDETNSFLGLAAAHLSGQPGHDVLGPILEELQSELFTLGADLATPLESRASVERVRPAHAARLETLIDRFDAEVPPLKHFILPTGTPAAAALHVCRTVCRRAERLTVRAAAAAPVNEQTVVYLNRLSDLLFVLARWVTIQSGEKETPWIPRRS